MATTKTPQRNTIRVTREQQQAAGFASPKAFSDALTAAENKGTSTQQAVRTLTGGGRQTDTALPAPTAAPTPIEPTVSPTAPQAGIPSPFVIPPGLPPALQEAVKGAPTAPRAELVETRDSLRRYQQGLQQAVATGVQAPQTRGAAQTGIQQFVPPAPQKTAVDAVFQEDPVFDKIIQSFNDFLSPKKQQESLVSEYQRLVKESGLQGINEQLIDAAKIISGTEDDIRKEVMAASGFATESQVQAMAIGRNKKLIENYNTLLATRDSIQQQISTMVSLSQADRAAANERANQQLNLGFQVLQYRDKMKQNAIEGYNRIVSQVGYDGLLSSLGNDGYAQDLVARTLGISTDGLRQLATRATQERVQAQAITERKEAREEARLGLEQARFGLEARRVAVSEAELAQKATTVATAQIQKTNAAVQKADLVIGKVDSALKRVSGGTTGFIGGTTRLIPGTPAYNLSRDIDTIKAQIGFGELQAMREASPTGGALGQVAVQELDMLQATLGSLDIGQSEQQLRGNLKAIKIHYQNWKQTIPSIEISDF